MIGEDADKDDSSFMASYLNSYLRLNGYENNNVYSVMYHVCVYVFCIQETLNIWVSDEGDRVSITYLNT